MSVHYDISKKVNEKLAAIEKYKQLDTQRELFISEAIDKYQSHNYVDLTSLNNLSKEINQLAIKYQLPQRKIVSKEMFLKYVAEQH